MEARSRRIGRIAIMWAAVGALLVAALISLDGSEEAGNRGPKTLGEIELLATATFFDEGPFYEGVNNPLRGNFRGSLGSTDSACIANRLIIAYHVVGGSVPDQPVAVSRSDNAGTTGNFTTTDFEDPPSVPNTYYLEVLPDEEKDCEGVISDPIVVN